jgi:hypothetical protein
MSILLMIVMMMTTPSPATVPLIKVAPEAKTGTPMMGCPAGYAIWFFSPEMKTVVAKNGDHLRRVVLLPNKLSMTTIHEPIYRRGRFECWQNGAIPPTTDVKGKAWFYGASQ